MKRYILKNREGAVSIAMREGLPICMLLAANPHANWRAGSAILIPPINWCEAQTVCAGFIKCDAPLIELSERYGVPMRMILAANNTRNPSDIKFGAYIRIPRLPEGFKMYTVRGAETFSDIAKKYNITEKALRCANPDIRGIYAGLQLIIPSK